MIALEELQFWKLHLNSWSRQSTAKDVRTVGEGLQGSDIHMKPKNSPKKSSKHKRGSAYLFPLETPGAGAPTKCSHWHPHGDTAWRRRLRWDAQAARSLNNEEFTPNPGWDWALSPSPSGRELLEMSEVDNQVRKQSDTRNVGHSTTR